MRENPVDPTDFIRQQAQTAPRAPLPNFTARELRLIAEHLEILTKARTTNERLGVPGLADTLNVEFPIGIRAVLRWTPGRPSATDHRCVDGRDRSAYQLDLMTPVTEPVIQLRQPQKTRDRRNDPQARRTGDRAKREAASQVLDIVLTPEARDSLERRDAYREPNAAQAYGALHTGLASGAKAADWTAGYVAGHADADPRS